MKSTDIDRRDREIKRSLKKQEILQRKQEKKGGLSIGDYINLLESKLFHDEQKIYNIKDNNVEVVEVLNGIKGEIDEKHWDNILRKAVNKTGIKQKDIAFTELKEVFSG